MTRKDYILIAGALRSEREQYDETENLLTCDACASSIAQALQTDNPRFDREHFLAVVRGEKSLTSRP